MVKTFMTIVGGLVLCVAGANAQDMLQVQGSSPDLYLAHTVKKGETFYSLGRSYSLSPKDIAAENSITLDKGLQLGQQVKIPLNNNNFSQKSDAVTGNTPVYHKVEEKETLYRLSLNHNKVPLDNIRHWNNLTGDGLKKDSYVIIGYLKANGGIPAPASTPLAATTPPSTPPASTPPPATTPVATAPVNTPPPVAKPDPAEQPAAAKPDTPAATPPPATTPAPEPAKTAPSAANAPFEQVYTQQIGNGKNVTTEKGPGGWFKSNAGAGKYYALHNTAQRGTIIKVTNPLNGKYIYAKVLESIPQIKQNAGLIIKLSDSALEALGTNDAKFYVELNYEDEK
jgi:LysM repeat protein